MAKPKQKKVTLTLQHTLLTSGQKVLALDFHPTRSELAAGTRTGQVLIIDVESGEVRNALTGHTDVVMAVAYQLPGGSRLLTTGKDRSLRLWNVASGEFERDLAGIVTGPMSRTLRGQMMQGGGDGHTMTTLAAAWSDSGLLVTGGQDSLVKVWRDGSSTRSFSWHAGPVVAVSFRPGSDRPFSASRDGSIRSWDTTLGSMVDKYLGHDDEIEAMAWLGTQRFASCDLHGTVLHWSVAAERPLETLADGTSAARCLASVLDSDVLFVGFESGDLVAYDAAERRHPAANPELLRVEAHDLAVRSLAVSRDGAWLASGGNDGSVKLWRLELA